MVPTPKGLDKPNVAKLAKLARIEVSEADQAVLAGQISGIMAWVEQLSEVNTDGVEPVASVTHMALRQRHDVISDGGYPAKVIANAPDAVDGFFAVPKMVE